MPVSPDSLVDLGLLEPWCRVNLPQGIAFAQAHDLAHYGDVKFVPFTVFVAAWESESAHKVAEELMSRRVRQGYPDRFSSTVGGLDALGFDWTDGVAGVLSYFVQRPTAVVEIQVARALLPDDEAARPLREVARALLGNVAWR